MTDLQAAAERWEQYRESLGGSGNPYGLTSGGDKYADLELLADAYLAMVPADDGEPADIDWAVSAGGTRQTSPAGFDYAIWKIGNIPGDVLGCETYVRLHPDALELVQYDLEDLRECGVSLSFETSTRGHVRRLLVALGVKP